MAEREYWDDEPISEWRMEPSGEKAPSDDLAELFDSLGLEDEASSQIDGRKVRDPGMRGDGSVAVDADLDEDDHVIDDVGVAAGMIDSQPLPAEPVLDHSSRLWPFLVGALGMALLFALGALAWLAFSDDADDATATIASTPLVGPAVDDLEAGAEQLRVILRGMGLEEVNVEVRDTVVYLVGTVPTDEAFANVVLASAALPSVDQVNLTELSSEGDSIGSFDIETQDEPEEAAPVEVVPPASADDRLALQTELDVLLEGVPVTFRPGSSEILKLPEAVLETAVVSLLNDYPGTAIRLIGRTDTSGADGDNLALSQSRGEAVRQLLIAQGVDESRLLVEAQGSAAATGDPDQDRRVDIEVVLADGS